MRLSEHLDLERVKVPLTGTTKEEVLRELVGLAEPDRARQDEIISALLQREAIQSTGIGHGVAIPHCIARVGAEIVLAAGIHAEGVDFGSSDDTPARIFVLVISSPGGRSMHLRMLTCISQLLAKEECREGLMAAADPVAFLAGLQEQEAKLHA